MSIIIDTILSVGKTLFGLRIELSKARQDRKQTVADFLAGIALSIEEASAQLRQGTYPAGKCQEILSHSQHMEEAIGELAAATEVDRLQRLAVLDQAAGLFRATAAFVRVSP